MQNLHRNRAGYDEALAQVIEHSQPNLIVCAGRMHILSPPFARRFADKVINLHPARPGMFPGCTASQPHTRPSGKAKPSAPE